MAIVASARMWKRWVIILGIVFYLFIFVLRHVPNDDVITTDHDNDKEDSVMIMMKLRSSDHDNLDLKSDQRMDVRVKGGIHPEVDRRKGEKTKSNPSDDHTALRNDKLHKNRALLAPSRVDDPVAYIVRNNTLIEVLTRNGIYPEHSAKNTYRSIVIKRPTNTSKTRSEGKIYHQEQSYDSDIMKHGTGIIPRSLDEYSSKRLTHPARHFHIAQDPLCKAKKLHPLCHKNTADPDCHAPIISCLPYLCSNQEEETVAPYLVVIIPSHPSNRYRREAIRDTWGAIARISITNRSAHKHKVAFVFLLGGSSSSEEQRQVAREYALYRDIVQYDVKDQYHLLSIKAILMLDWIYHFCKGAQYFLKTDDDVYLNISNVLKSLEGEKTEGLLIGSMHANSEVQRSGQWKVGLDVYPSPTYPPYCSGTAYVMSQDVARELYTNHYSLKENLGVSGGAPVPMEDVYITGVLAEYSKRICEDRKVFPNWTTGPSPRTVETFLKGKVLGIHGLSASGIYGLEKLARDCPKCAKNRTLLQQWFPLLTGAS